MFLRKRPIFSWFSGFRRVFTLWTASSTSETIPSALSPSPGAVGIVLLGLILLASLVPPESSTYLIPVMPLY